MVQLVKTLPTVQETPAAQEAWARSPSWEGPLEEEIAATPVFLPVNPTDRGVWRATARGVANSQTRLSD